MLSNRIFKILVLMALSIVHSPSQIRAQDVTPAATGVTVTASMVAGGPSRTGEMPGPGPAGQPALAWQLDTGDRIFASPVVSNGNLYVGSYELPGETPLVGTFRAIDIESGIERWHFDRPDHVIWSGAAVLGDRVYFGSGDVLGGGELHALDTVTGEQVWQFATEGNVVTDPLVQDSVVYFGTDFGDFYALDASNGSLIWTRNTGPSKVRSTPSFANGMIFYTNDAGTLYARNALSGKAKWQFSTGGGSHWSIAVAAGLVYVDVFETGTLVAVDAESGTERWRATTGGMPDSRGVAVSNGVAYVFAYGVTALNAATGELLWSAALSTYPSSTPVIADGIIYFSSGSGELTAFDTVSRQELWRVPVGKVAGSSPVILDGAVYVCSKDGPISAIRST